MRTLTLLETLTGVVTIALMISLSAGVVRRVPRREARLLTLDDPMGGRITPMRVIALNAPGGDVEMLYRAFGEWEMWTADVLESHVSYPMLALFRSQHAGQSWVTALGVVTDAATLASACMEGAQSREPYFLYRRGRRAILEISSRSAHSPERPAAVSWLNEANFDLAWNGLVETGLPLRDKAHGVGGPAGAGPATATSSSADRLPGRAARLLGPLRRGDSGRGGGGGGQRGPHARRRHGLPAAAVSLPG